MYKTTGKGGVFKKMKTENLKLNNSGNHVVRFHSPTCTPCKYLEPIFDELTKAYPDINFCSVDITSPDSSTITKALGIRSVPTVVCIRDGGVKDILVGAEATSVNRLKEAVEKLE